MRGIKLLAVLALAGCALVAIATLAMVLAPGAQPDPGPAQSGAALTAEQYHELVRKNVPSLASRDDGNLDRLAVSVCEVFRAGGTWAHVIKGMLDAGISGGDAGRYARIAVTWSCPEYEVDLPAG
ncbi:hypothetical protein FHR32_005114 [Streptosporangium album]|uniref:DUF732 domain-containing protein n=1 Tax=Streptosporangium album TaxID=47479 RepID=A0A7W7WAS4_9ACTN|nr:DUF732 domain-containing protein [Streptosporangium album]MBB4940737.1 hypothetical protein [Streptosporangium album]